MSLCQCGPMGGGPAHTAALLKRRLNRAELNELSTKTRLHEREVKALYARFRRVTSPETAMTFQQFRNTLGIIGESSGTWLPEAMFRVFCAGDKTLSYDRYIRSLAIMLRGTEDEKLELSFKMATIGSLENRARGDQAAEDELADKVMGLPEFENLLRATDSLRRSLVSHPSLEITPERIIHLFDELASKGVMAGGGSGESGGHVITLEDYKNAARTNHEFLAMLGFQTSFLRGRTGSVIRMTLTSQNSGPIQAASPAAGSFPAPLGSRARDDKHLRQKLDDIKGALRSLQDDCKAMRKMNAATSIKNAHIRRPCGASTGPDDVDVQIESARQSRSRPSTEKEDFWPANEKPTPSVSSSMPIARGDDAPASPSSGKCETEILEEKIRLILEQFADVHVGEDDAYHDFDAGSSPRSPGARGKRIPSQLLNHEADYLNIGGTPGARRSVSSAKEGRNTVLRSGSKADLNRSFTQSKKKQKMVQKVHRLLGPKKGMAVHFGHENWNMVLNMMVGIRIALGRISNEPRRELHEFDFMNKEKFSIAPRLGNILDSVAGSKIQCTRFVDYSAFVFRKVRELNGINTDDYLRSVGPEQLLGNMILGNLSSLSELSSEGKSGAFFYYTADGNFMIKTVTKQEKDLLRSMMHDYWTHMRNNPNSLLIHFYGLHSLRVKKNGGRSTNTSTYQKLYFVVMGNMFSTHLDIQRRYDLKGSRLGRSTPEDQRGDETVALRDNDFVDDVKNGVIKKIRLNPAKRTALIEQIKRDTAFLEQKNIIDYSLLLGLHTFEKSGREEYVLDLEEMSPAELGIHPDDAATHTAAEEATMLEEWKKRQEFRNGIFSMEDDPDADGTVYFLGMIDILTYYGASKKLEHNFKAMQHPAHRKEISCCPPDNYALRFTKFMEEEIFTDT